MSGITNKLGAVSGVIGTVTKDADDLGSPANCTKVWSFWHDDSVSGVGAESDGTLVLSQSVGNANVSLGYYYLSCYIPWSYYNMQINNTDAFDLAVVAWLEAGDGAKYRFGFYKASGMRHNNMLTIGGGYWLADADAGHADVKAGSAPYEWNQSWYTIPDVAGNTGSDQTRNPSSGFTSGDALTLNVRMGCLTNQTAIYYNRANHNVSTASHRAFYTIKEFSAVGD